MSWKMFWQIVLLIVIATVVSSVLRGSLLHYKRGWCKGKYLESHPERMHKK